MKSIDKWLEEYGESHQNPTNKTIHWICVPLIFFSILGLLYTIKISYFNIGQIQGNVALVILTFTLIFYFTLSKSLSFGMFLFSSFCIFLCYLIEDLNFVPLWQVCVTIFVLAWIGQFWGHKVEGKKPSFFKDLLFLMIGPAWLMSFIYQRLGIHY
ncbi:Mpo1 family 2-hydroxy fatty acid dioxygenase [Arcicella rigui]|uniref:Mpo1-like protein n=1 Tax=Arcicella rigui TaxID=797020 RepID=A0ABU5Q954_9BACT|nr:Mpo1-like protein [Arcicella rigui]MEA5139354.1 Mpo1-like protein [Arcicella rigui]